MKKRSSIKTEERNLGVIVLAGTICFLSLTFALSMLPLKGEEYGYFICSMFVAMLALAVAIYSRVSMLRQLVESIFRAFF